MLYNISSSSQSKLILSFNAVVVLLGKNRYGARDFAYSYTVFRSVVCFSVGRLSYSCPLFKPFYGFRRHLASTLAGSIDKLYQMGVSDLWRKGRFRCRTPKPKHAIANCFSHLANKNEELRGLTTAIPPLTELLSVSRFHNFCLPRF